MTRWEQLEEWLYETRPLGGRFTQEEVAERFDVTGRAATAYIRAHLDAQRSIRSRTLYLIHREGRTSKAIWIVGVRSADARALSHQYFDDVRQRFLIAVEPDLVRIGALNPRARRKCEAIVAAVGEGAMRLLQVAVDGIDVDGDGTGAPA